MLGGAAWPGGRHAPQLIMAPVLQDGILTKTWIDRNWKHFIRDCGFDGFHVPMQGAAVSPALKFMLQRCDEAGVWVHLWMYGDQQGGTAPGSLNGDRNHQRAVLMELAPYTNWSMGLGYDIQEWADDPEIESWFKFAKNIVPDHLLGARRLNIREPHPGNYAGYEWHALPRGAFERQLDDAVNAANGLPVMWEERGRVRGLYEKDYEDFEIFRKHMKLAVEANVAGIWGFQGGNESVSHYGSSRLPRPETYKAFLKGAFNGPGEEEDMSEVNVASGWSHVQDVNIADGNTTYNDGFVLTEAKVLTGVRIWTPFHDGRHSTQVVISVDGKVLDEVFASLAAGDYASIDFAPDWLLPVGSRIEVAARSNAGGNRARVRWLGYND